MASPYADKAGFVRGQRSGANKGWVTLYVAAEQGMDVGTDKWAVVCETHGTIVGAATRARGVQFLQVPEFCEACMEQRSTEPNDDLKHASPCPDCTGRMDAHQLTCKRVAKKVGIKFTFKRGERSTGLAAVANPYTEVDIKLNKKRVGTLAPPNWRTSDGMWRARFTVTDSTQKAGWRWVQLKARFKDEDEARAWVAEHAEQIASMFTLHSLDY